ncbi:MAG: general secretion pathway protein GspK [Betaproteobacteria bacterium]|jgi:general secretion pathway protein K|nr:general secretion pathway protein GspK [Betaproteobacteria bacterium]
MLKRALQGPRQRGAAIVTALLIVALATTIVSALFARQSATVRTIENRLAITQARWIERAAIDWARVILRQDARSSSTDHLGEPWAVPVADTRVDASVGAGGALDSGATPATLSGQILDMQGRFNLANVVPGGRVDPVEAAALASLLTLVGQPSSLAEPLIARLLAATPLVKEAAGGGAGTATGTATGTESANSSRPTAFPIRRAADLLTVPGFDAVAVAALEPLIVMLPRAAPVNINTASAEVIAARTGVMDLPQARAFVATRERVPFRDLTDANQAYEPQAQIFKAERWAVTSAWFLVRGAVRYDRIESRSDTLLERKGRELVELVWQDRY